MPNVTYEQMRKVRDEFLREYLKKGVYAIPFAKEVVEQLSPKYKMALVSSGERFWADKVLDELDLVKYLQVRVFGEDVANHKPDPEPFLKASQELEVRPEECVVIEDSESGFKAAKAAGMTLIARKAEHNKDLDFSLADFIVEDLDEIPKILTKLNN